MSSKTHFSDDEIKLADAAFAQWPKKEKPATKKEVVAKLKTRIQELRSKGYTFEEIAQGLKKSIDLQLSTTSLRTYLSEAEAAKPKRKRKKAAPKVQKDAAEKEDTKKPPKPDFLMPPEDETDVYD